MKKLLLAGALLAMAATPALAESYAPDFGTANVAGPTAYGAGSAPARRPLGYQPGSGGYGYGGAGYAVAGPGYGTYAMAEPAAGPVVGPNSRCWVSTDDSRGTGYFGRCGSWNNDTDSNVLGLAEPNTSLLPPN